MLQLLEVQLTEAFGAVGGVCGRALSRNIETPFDSSPRRLFRKFSYFHRYIYFILGYFGVL
jgi:hypothetical protein